MRGHRYPSGLYFCAVKIKGFCLCRSESGIQDCGTAAALCPTVSFSARYFSAMLITSSEAQSPLPRKDTPEKHCPRHAFIFICALIVGINTGYAGVEKPLMTIAQSGSCSPFPCEINHGRDILSLNSALEGHFQNALAVAVMPLRYRVKFNRSKPRMWQYN